VAALGQPRGGGQAGRPGAHHGDRLRAGRGRMVDSSVSWQARGLTRQLASLFWKMWSRQAWLQAMQVLISSARPAARLLHEVGVGQQGRAIDTMSAQPSASTCSATSGVLMRLLVTSGVAMPSAQARRIFLVTQANAGARHAGGDGGHARLVPADAGVDDVAPPRPRPCPG
jgi:hypothetical protein